MSFEFVGVNLSASTNITPINISLENNINTLLQQLPETTNTATNNLYGFVVGIIIFIALTWALSDKTQFGDFRFTELRASAISAGIVSNLLVILLMIGWVSTLRIVGGFEVLYIILLLAVSFFENKE